MKFATLLVAGMIASASGELAGGGKVCPCVTLEEMNICSHKCDFDGTGFGNCVYSTNANTGPTAAAGKGVEYPADYGGSCKIHPEPGSDAVFNLTTGMPRPDAPQDHWTMSPYCWVSPCSCNQAMLPDMTAFWANGFTDQTGRYVIGQSSDDKTGQAYGYYSYSNCDPDLTVDPYAAVGNLEADEGLAYDESRAVWESEYGLCPGFETQPPRNECVPLVGRFAGGGKVCPCVSNEEMHVCSHECDFAENGFGKCIYSLNENPAPHSTGKGIEYPADYGSSCKIHAEPGSADMFDLDTGMARPDAPQDHWTMSPYCWVSPCSCNQAMLSDMTAFWANGFTDQTGRFVFGQSDDDKTGKVYGYYSYSNCDPAFSSDPYAAGGNLEADEGLAFTEAKAVWESEYGLCPRFETQPPRNECPKDAEEMFRGMTCGDVKEAYRLNECCGQPEKLFEV